MHLFHDIINDHQTARTVCPTQTANMVARTTSDVTKFIYVNLGAAHKESWGQTL